MADVTHLLSAIEQGDPQAAGELLPLVYEELRQLIAGHLLDHRPGRALQPATVVQQAYQRLVGKGPEGQCWKEQGPFFAAAAEAMRRLLVERARLKQPLASGSGRGRPGPEHGGPARPSPREDLLALDAALTKFAATDPQSAN